MRKYLLLIFLFGSILQNATLAQEFQTASFRPSLALNVTKTGPYLGIQQGKYTIAEIGAERIWKKIRLRDPITQAVHMGFNYNFKYRVLGYDVGYWIRPHRLGLTYGVNAFYRTDFDLHKVGLAPVLGYKFWFLHLQTGYHAMIRPKDFETNTFFISLRMSIINDYDISLERKKKKKPKNN